MQGRGEEAHTAVAAAANPARRRKRRLAGATQSAVAAPGNEKARERVSASSIISGIG